MRTKAITALADVICRAQQQDRTPAGIAFAIDAAGMLQSPETAAELATLRERVAVLEAAAAESRPVDEDPIAYALTPAAEPVCRVLPARDAICACGHTGLDHHHGDTACWAHLPRERPANASQPWGPVLICQCKAFAEDPIAYALTPKAAESAAKLRALMGGGPRV